MKGDLRKTGNTMIVEESEMREVVKWRGKVVGIAESFFPDPAEWRMKGADEPLDRLSVRVLTRVFSWATHIDPACWDAWEKRIGALPKDVGERYNTRLLTPRDWASHFKNILHRALMVRSITTGEPCRCCNFARENMIHFATCEVAGKLWSDLLTLTGREDLRDQKERERFALFALLPNEHLEAGWVN